jgi:hypothetical protein
MATTGKDSPPSPAYYQFTPSKSQTCAGQYRGRAERNQISWDRIGETENHSQARNALLWGPTEREFRETISFAAGPGFVDGGDSRKMAGLDFGLIRDVVDSDRMSMG